MKSDLQFSENEVALMNSVLDEISNEVVRITGIEPRSKGQLTRKFVFGSEKKFKEVQFGFSVNRESLLEFGIVARLSKPCDKPECFMDRLKEIFDQEDDIQFQLPDIVRINYKCCVNIDDYDFERMLKCIEATILEKFTSTYSLLKN